jgi:hypothetical protein
MVLGMATLNLPTGTWSIFGNEEQGQMVITAVDSQGNLTGTAFGDPITGAYHAPSGLIHFSRKVDPSILKSQVYTGHISIVTTGVDAPQYLLAGSYITIPFGLRPHFGWYATITKVIV